MSMFRKPKKPMLRKVFNDDDEKMDIDQEKSSKDRDRDRSRRDRDKDRDRNRSDNRDTSRKVSSSTSTSSGSLGAAAVEKKKALLSFADDVDGKEKICENWVTGFMVFLFVAEEEGEVFQVKKSSHSKKVSRMLDKERRKKAKEKNHEKNKNGDRHEKDRAAEDELADEKRQKADNIQTEIRTDDFVVSFFCLSVKNPCRLVMFGLPF